MDRKWNGGQFVLAAWSTSFDITCLTINFILQSTHLMNSLAIVFAVALLLATVFFGCDSTATESTQNSTKNTPTDKVSPRDQYISEFAALVDSILNSIEPVQDSDSEKVALRELERLKQRSENLGKSMDKLKEAVKDDVEASDKLARYLQDELKRTSGDRFSRIRSKLGKSKSNSEYPELWEAASELINNAMRD